MLTHKAVTYCAALIMAFAAILFAAGCTPSWHSRRADSIAYNALANARSEAVSPEAAEDDFSIDFKPLAIADVVDLSAIPANSDTPVTLTLDQCLKIALHNNLEIQNRKEELYLEALTVANTRHDYTGFSGFAEGDVSRTITAKMPDYNTVDAGNGDLGVSFTHKLAHGGVFTLGAGLQLATDLVHLNETTLGSNLTAEFTQPLLRGAWYGFAFEDMYRQDRDLLISTFEFERFVQSFCSDIIEQYLRVLQSLDTLKNETNNIERLELALSRIRLQVEGGEATRVDQNQAEGDLLNARARLMAQRTNYKNALDRFKITIGLPLNVNIELDSGELSQLSGRDPASIPLLDQSKLAAAAEAAAASAAVRFDQRNGKAEDRIMKQIRQSIIDRSRENAYEKAFDTAVDSAAVQAIEIALHAQPECLRKAAELRDSRRDMEKAANDFLPGLDLTGDISTINTKPRRPWKTDFGRYESNLSLELDYSFDQTDNRLAYRTAEIDYARTQREAGDFVRGVHNQIRRSYRSLVESRRTYDIRKKNLSLSLAQQKLTAMQQAEGRASTRDVLEAEESLRNAQNNLTSAAIDYETSRLSFLADLGLLDVNSDGQYTMRPSPQLFEMIEKRYGGLEAMLTEQE